MQIAASTDGNSSFVMPLSSKSNISNADFVVFVQPEQADTLDDVALRKLSFERRRRTEFEAGSRMNIDMALDVRPDVEVELDVAAIRCGVAAPGALNLQINPRDNVFMINGDYTIAEGSFMLSLQQIINKALHDRERVVDPVDGFADECPAGHRRRVQGQGVAAAAAAGDVGDIWAATVRLPVECVIHLRGFPLESEHRVRCPGSGFGPRDGGRGGQCALDARDGRHAVPLPAALQQLHVRELVAGLVEHRQARCRRPRDWSSCRTWSATGSRRRTTTW